MKIVITGASSGIGFQAALALASAGHRVLALARSEAGLQRLQAEVSARDPESLLTTLPFDVIHGDHQQELLPFIGAHLGNVDVLINNAGALINKPFMETGREEWLNMLQSNLLGHVSMIQNLLPLMQKGAHVVNVGSMGGFQGSVKFPGLTAYSASKSALHTLTECLASELSETGIKINCLALGSAQTEMLAKAFPGYESPVAASDMGDYIAQFALSGHRFFNGKILPVAVTTP